VHRARLWLSAVAFSTGVLVGWREPNELVVICAASLGSTMVPVRNALARLAGLVLVAFACGTVVVSLHVARAAPVVTLADRYPRCHVVGTVSQRTPIGTFIRLRRGTCNGKPLPSGADVVMADATGELGGRIATTAWLTPLEDEGIDGARRRAGAAASMDAEAVRVRKPTGLIYRAALTIRASLRRATEGLSSTTAGLLRGLAIGETDRMPPQSKESLRRAGLSHLVAVSGTNVTIVLTVVASVVGRISRRVRMGACSGALVLFVAVVGPEPSVLRAAAMGGVGLVALMAGSRSSPLDALALAVVSVLAVRPQMIHSVGLHLSVAATAGICLWASHLHRRWRYGPGWLRAALAVTVSAQAAVAPLLIIVFGEISVTSVPANLLAAPAVAPATVIALAAAVVGLASDAAARGLVSIAAPFADWIATIGEWLGAADWTSVSLRSPFGVLASLVLVGVLAIGGARADRASRRVAA
jgi:competence protein ComEC